MTDLLVPDTLDDLKAYLISHPLLSPLTGSRVWFRIPPKPSASPFIRLYKSGGGMGAGEVPVDNPRITHEVWGTAPEDYDSLRLVVRTLKTIYQGAQNVPMGSSVLQNAEVTSDIDAPDPDLGWPRLVLDVALIVITA